jgi:hypothetical protein
LDSPPSSTGWRESAASYFRRGRCRPSRTNKAVP